MSKHPLIIRHRINSLQHLQTVDPRYGVEIDIRHDNRSGRYYLNHDPGVGEDFESYIQELVIRKHPFVILNIKEAGIEESVIEIVTKLGVQGWFLLDVEFPFLYKAAYKGVPHLQGCVAVRFSEMEPVELALTLAGRCSWVWIDVTSRLPLTADVYQDLRRAGYKLALVCPERWGRPEDIAPYIAFMKEHDMQVDTVMTAEPYVAIWEKSGVIRTQA